MQQRRRRYAYFQKSWSAEFIPRTLFYWSKMYIEGFKEGQAYTSLTRCITINLVSQGFNLNSAVHSAYNILEQNSYQQLTDLLEIHFLNLSAAQEIDIQNTPVEKQQKLINSYVFCQAEKRNFLVFLCLTAPVPVNPCLHPCLIPLVRRGQAALYIPLLYSSL